MISYIRGILSEVSEDGIVVETGNIGYEIRVPVSVLEKLPSLGSEIKIYTYMQVREDGISLFGFLGKADLSMFRQLLGVNGIGPKGALGVLSVLSPDSLRMAIISGDAKAIAKAPGIGSKTAQRVILDLKDKVSLEEVLYGGGTPEIGAAVPKAAAIGPEKEAIEALTALGYSPMEAARAVRRVEITSEMTAEDILKQSLKQLI